MKKNLNPKFDTQRIGFYELCWGDIDLAFLFEVWNWNRYQPSELIGFCFITVRDLLHAQTTEIEIRDKKNKKTGTVKFNCIPSNYSNGLSTPPRRPKAPLPTLEDQQAPEKTASSQPLDKATSQKLAKHRREHVHSVPIPRLRIAHKKNPTNTPSTVALLSDTDEPSNFCLSSPLWKNPAVINVNSLPVSPRDEKRFIATTRQFPHKEIISEDHQPLSPNNISPSSPQSLNNDPELESQSSNSSRASSPHSFTNDPEPQNQQTNSLPSKSQTDRLSPFRPRAYPLLTDLPTQSSPPPNNTFPSNLQTDEPSSLRPRAYPLTNPPTQSPPTNNTFPSNLQTDEPSSLRPRAYPYPLITSPPTQSSPTINTFPFNPLTDQPPPFPFLNYNLCPKGVNGETVIIYYPVPVVSTVIIKDSIIT
jgi:hypothetical protein